jgi:hypothetical protein
VAYAEAYVKKKIHEVPGPPQLVDARPGIDFVRRLEDQDGRLGGRDETGTKIRLALEPAGSSSSTRTVATPGRAYKSLAKKAGGPRRPNARLGQLWRIDHAWAFNGTTVDRGAGAGDESLSLHAASTSNPKIDNTPLVIVTVLIA